MIESTLLADAVTIGSIFLISLILLSLLGRSISDYVRQSRIGAIDRSLGFLFGLIRGGVVLCLLYIGLVQIAAVNETPIWLKEAKSNDLLRLGAEGLLKLVPPDSRPSLEWNSEPTGTGATAAAGSAGPAAPDPAAPTTTGSNPDAAGDGAGKIGYKPDQRQALENLFRIQRPDGQNTDGNNTDAAPDGDAGGGSSP
jgi:membrane protein required for colicin V production